MRNYHRPSLFYVDFLFAELCGEPARLFPADGMQDFGYKPIQRRVRR